MGFFKKMLKKSVGGKVLSKTDPAAKKLLGSDKKSKSNTTVKSALMSKLGGPKMSGNTPPQVGAGSGVGRAQAARNEGLKMGGKRFNHKPR